MRIKTYSCFATNPVIKSKYPPRGRPIKNCTSLAIERYVFTALLALMLTTFVKVPPASAVSFTTSDFSSETHTASTAFSTAVIDWSSLTFSGIDITFVRTISTSSVNFIPDAYDDAFDQDFSVTTFGNTAAAFEVLGGAGSAETSETIFSATISEFADGTIPELKKTSGTATAIRQAAFVANETGNLTVEADYYIAQAASTTGLPIFASERRNSRSSITLDLAVCEISELYPFLCGDAQEGSRDLVEFYNIVSNGDSMSNADSGTLRVTLPYEIGQGGGFAVRAAHYLSTSSTLVGPVPEPTTIFLLGSGLIVLAGFGRKKFFKK